MTDLLLCFDFPPIGGGIARWMAELALRYPPGELVVSTGTVTNAGDQRFGGVVDRLAIPSHRLKTIAGLIRWRRRVRRLVATHPIEFVWCGNIRPAAYVAWRTLERDGVPYGILLHGGDLLQLRARYRKSVFKRATAGRLLGQARYLVANSAWTAGLTREVLAELGVPDHGRVVVVPLGTDPARFRPDIPAAAVAGRYGLGPGRMLLTVARLVPHKGIDVAIAALARLRPRFPDLEYVVAGEGPDRERLRGLAAQAGVTDAVRFLGDVPDQDLPPLYARAEVYLGLSRQQGLDVEGFGIAIADAAGAGVAVVAGASGGTAEAVGHGVTGLRVEADDSEAVARAVAELFEEPARRRAMGRAGREWAEREGNWDRVVARLRALSRAAASSDPL